MTVVTLDGSDWNSVVVLDQETTTIRHQPLYAIRETESPWEVKDLCRHCAKNVQKRSFFWSVFSGIWTEYVKIRTRKNSVLGHFLRSDYQCPIQDALMINTRSGVVVRVSSLTFTFFFFAQIIATFQRQALLNKIPSIAPLILAQKETWVT